MAYTREIKEMAKKMMLPPNPKSVNEISQATNVPIATLKFWKKQLRQDGMAAPASDSPADRWSSSDKFLIVFETFTLNEIELAEYCRQKGLYVEQVQQWKAVCQQANDVHSSDLVEFSKKQRVIEKELKETKAELKRKEAALAETAALLVLSKKARAIWGTPSEGN
jgi:transposase